MDLDETVENVKVKMVEHMSLLASRNAPTKKMTMTVNSFDIYNGVKKWPHRTHFVITTMKGMTASVYPSFSVSRVVVGLQTSCAPSTRTRRTKRHSLHKAHQDMLTKSSPRCFDCGTLRDAQAVVSHVSSFSGHPSLLFSQAIEPLNMDD